MTSREYFAEGLTEENDFAARAGLIPSAWV